MKKIVLLCAIMDHFVMPGIECSDVDNPIQCEGTDIVVTDPRDCPQKCFGGDFDSYFMREKTECKLNVEQENINFQLCSTRLVVGDLSFCPVKCIIGQLSGFYVMENRDCNWTSPKIKICENGFVFDNSNFIAKCPGNAYQENLKGIMYWISMNAITTTLPKNLH